jgi:GntR family histidine utilization transcriptional repressor
MSQALVKGYTAHGDRHLKQEARLSWTDVRNRIQTRILDRTYSPGDKLPRDEDIAVEFGCARSTVQRAMRELSNDGLVERKRKGGTHVRIDPVTRATFEIPITRREVENRGGKYDYHLISSEMAKTPPSVMAKFGLTSATEMLRVQALHMADNRPYILEDRWVSTATVPEILGIDLSVESANEWLVRNKPYNRCDIRFYAMKANAIIARSLDTNQDEALLVIERTTWIGTNPITSVQAVTAPGYQLLTQI